MMGWICPCPVAPLGSWQHTDAQSDANALLAAVNCQPASLAAGNFVSEGKEEDEAGLAAGEVQVWCCRCGVQDAGMLWVPAINSSARGEPQLRNCQAGLLAQLRTWQGETYGEKKRFGKRDFIALGLCEENNHFITA